MKKLLTLFCLALAAVTLPAQTLNPASLSISTDTNGVVKSHTNNVRFTGPVTVPGMTNSGKYYGDGSALSNLPTSGGAAITNAYTNAYTATNTMVINVGALGATNEVRLTLTNSVLWFGFTNVVDRATPFRVVVFGGGTINSNSPNIRFGEDIDRFRISTNANSINKFVCEAIGTNVYIIGNVTGYLQ